MTDRRVPYREFSQQVRRFHPNRLLEKVAEVSTELERAAFATAAVPHWDPRGPVRQFSLAFIARTTILEGTIHRPDKRVTDRQIHELCGLSIDVDHPDVPEVGLLEDRVLTRMFARIMYQQSLFGYSNFENITRSLGLLVHHHPDIRGLPTEEEWKAALGVPLTTYMATVFHLAISALRHRGRLCEDAIREYVAVGAFAGLDTDAVLKIMRTQLSADRLTLKNIGKSAEIEDAQMWSFNPLMAAPFVSHDGQYLLPIHDYLIQKITPLGLYFTGLHHFGSDFPRALGDSFEKYVGEHLHLLERAGAEVHHEITYGRENNLTVDYLVVLPEVVLLVEVKGARATENARAGIDAGLENLVKKVQGARDQIDNTAQLIADRIPELIDIPADRPIRGLVVTLEPIQQIDTFLYYEMFESNNVETATISAHDLERIVPILSEQSDVGVRILEALTFRDPTPPSLDRSVSGLPSVRNPVSDELWDLWIDRVPELKPN